MSLRPSNTPPIQLNELKPGDVIMSRAHAGGESLMAMLDQLILQLDQGDYTHCALYTGLRDGEHFVIEGIRAGVKHDSISVDLDAQVLVDVYRFQSPDGQHLDQPQWPSLPVLEAAEKLVGSAYAYSELAMLALVLEVTESHFQGDSQQALRDFASELVQQFSNWLNSDSKDAMTCVQVVTTAFYNAQSQPASKYALQANPNIIRKPPANAPQASAALAEDDPVPGLKSVLRDLLGPAYPVQAEWNGVPFPPVFTPRDLQSSPSLKLVGCLKNEMPQ